MSLGSPSYHPNVRVAAEGHVTTVVIDNQAAKNACTGDMWVALGATFRDLSYSGARAIVLTGAGQDFCAGADLTGSGDGGESPATSGHILHGMRVLADVVLSVHDCPVPVIARVDGVCVGAGLGLALATDMIWCSDRSRFSAIFAKRGLSLDFGTSWLLRQRIGVHKAKEMALTGKMISGAGALELGLVNAVVPIDQLDRATQEIVDAVAAGPPVALSMAKRELDNAPHGSLGQALEAEALAQSINVQTDDLREALMAYAERRPPNFSGR
ncbi:MAG TPA: enoyl-CoA hydratase-related protein [Acidimicrobiales bacterium]|nr:enoyl-CoA hydratase-related protein [Acidimicrobiales bacterium]